MRAPHTGTHRHCEAGIGAGAALPLIQHGRTIGVLLLYSAEKNAFDEEVVQAVDAHGPQRRLCARQFQTRGGAQGAEEQLRTADARLKRATRGANDGLWEFDVASREMWVSERFAEMFGFEQQRISRQRARNSSISCMRKTRRSYAKRSSAAFAKTFTWTWKCVQKPKPANGAGIAFAARWNAMHPGLP